MARIYFGEMRHSCADRSCGFLAVCWICGSISGIFCFLQAEASVFSLMHRAVTGSVSIVGLFCIYFIPFLFTVYSVFLSEPWILFLICFCKAFLHSFVMLGIHVVYGSSGWLMYRLLLGNVVITFCLYVSWSRLLSGGKISAVFCCVFSAMVCAADYYIIAPFLADLIEI